MRLTIVVGPNSVRVQLDDLIMILMQTWGLWGCSAEEVSYVVENCVMLNQNNRERRRCENYIINP